MEIDSARDAADPFVSLNNDEKQAVLKDLVVTRRSSVAVLRRCVPRHQNMTTRTSTRQEKKAAVLREEFALHRCSKACLILESEAVQAGLYEKNPLTATELQECTLILNLRSNGKKRKNPPQPEMPRKQVRTSLECSSPGTVFPFILPQTEKDKIVEEFRESTSNAALKRYECSFCGKLELATDVKMRPVTELDISLLGFAVKSLRENSSQPLIESFKNSSLIDRSTYVLCHLCNLSVKHHKFQTIPLRSYANGLWIGEVPPELKDLTLLEERF
ncbi:hypothetical protein R3P38DRAFT_2512268 [Favolaschia claudopus]|uniref:DUF6570 domain-containing protein n=1 Tax=Favolaschia claudopus TaxID=2862362 RepID=A0AAW0CQC6_9AGAR